MILESWSIALITCSAVVIIFGLVGAATALRLLKDWDLGSDSELQIKLEERIWLVATLVRDEGLRPLERDAVGRVVEQSARRAEDGERLSLQTDGEIDAEGLLRGTSGRSESRNNGHSPNWPSWRRLRQCQPVARAGWARAAVVGRRTADRDD